MRIDTTASAAPGAGFRLDRQRHAASFNGVQLGLDPSAFAVLQVLLDAGGAQVDAGAFGHADGASRLWMCVARLNEALARCAPAAGNIVHVASADGQGYQLTHAAAPGRLVLGRSGELARVARLLENHRFVTIAGPGGMGKTTLARAVVAQCQARYPDGVCFIDLAVLAEGRALVGALGAALGISDLAPDGLPQLASFLGGKRMLILLDCCEHHIGVAAHTCEALLRAAPDIDVLCTSREPLLAQSEQIVRLGPMALPDGAAARHAGSAIRYAAVELFLARANGDKPARLVLDERTAPLVCSICHAVEGVPLALELAAALVRPMGLEMLAQQTAKWLLQAASRTGRPGHRHRSVSDMLDWSYDTLAPHEQKVLRSLAVFRGGFTLEAAAAVAADVELDPDSVLDTVMTLAGKSLVQMRPEDAGRLARLLDLTREYVCAKLSDSAEREAVQERHARWLGMLMERMEVDWMRLSRAQWLNVYRGWVDDLLAAIDWALGPGKQLLLGAQLAGIGFSLGDQLGVAREFHQRVQRALGLIGSLRDVPTPVLLRLNFVNAYGPGLATTGILKLLGNAEWVVRLARQSGSPMLQGASLIAIWGSPFVRGNYPASLAGARRIAGAARNGEDVYLELIGHRTLAQSLHFMGRHAAARRCVELALANSELRIPLAYQPSPVQVGTSMRIVLARLLWMEGAADRAVAMSETALALSESDRPSAMCQVLAMAAIPLALWRGDSGAAAPLVRRLRERASGHGLGFWIEWAQRIEDAIAVIDLRADPPSLPSIGDRHDFFAKCGDHLVTFSPRLLTGDASDRCERGLVGWCAPELLRAQALGLLATDTDDTDGAAGVLLRRSMALARRQGALAWLLRSATSMAALHQRQGAALKARALLEPVLARCLEGHATADLRAAQAMLKSLR